MRKLLIKISVAVALIAFAIGVTHLFKDVILKGNTDSFGTISITIEDSNGRSETKEVEFSEGDYLYDVLERTYSLRCEDSMYGKTLYDVEWIKTDFFTSYVAIYVNDEYASVGISSITLEDGMRIKLKETKL